MQKLRVGILFGGRSGEHEVSINSAASIQREIDSAKYAVTMIGITREGIWLTGVNTLDALRAGETHQLTPVMLINDHGHYQLVALDQSTPKANRSLAELDVIFPVLHGSFGEDGCPQGLLEMLDIPYVGAGVLASSVIMDKALFKAVMRANGLPVLESLTFTRRQVLESLTDLLDQAEALSPYPLFTKPVNLGSSVGISRCTSRVELAAGLQDAARYDLRVMVERGVVNPLEIEVSVLGNNQPEVSLPGQIIPSDSFYSYAAKYLDGKSQLLVPAPLPDKVSKSVRQLAVLAYQATDCAGMARADFLIDPATWQIYISELNTIPGFTSISMYPKAWQASGLSYSGLIDRLIELALARKAEKDALVRTYAPPQG